MGCMNSEMSLTPSARYMMPSTAETTRTVCGYATDYAASWQTCSLSRTQGGPICSIHVYRPTTPPYLRPSPPRRDRPICRYTTIISTSDITRCGARWLIANWRWCSSIPICSSLPRTSVCCPNVCNPLSTHCAFSPLRCRHCPSNMEWNSLTWRLIPI